MNMRMYMHACTYYDTSLQRSLTKAQQAGKVTEREEGKFLCHFDVEALRDIILLVLPKPLTLSVALYMTLFRSLNICVGPASNALLFFLSLYVCVIVMRDQTERLCPSELYHGAVSKNVYFLSPLHSFTLHRIRCLLQATEERIEFAYPINKFERIFRSGSESENAPLCWKSQMGGEDLSRCAGEGKQNFSALARPLVD